MDEPDSTEVTRGDEQRVSLVDNADDVCDNGNTSVAVAFVLPIVSTCPWPP